MKKPNNYQQIEESLVKIEHPKGNHGTGFHIGSGYLITNCHCLHSIPDPAKFFSSDELLTAVTVKSLLSEEVAKAAIVYADPCGDIAVLHSLDDQQFPDEAESYERLLDGLAKVTVNLRQLKRSVEVILFVRNVDGVWVSGEAFSGRGLMVNLDEKEIRIEPGASGSPVINEDGICVGVLKIGSAYSPEYNALALPDYLPVWLWGHFKNRFPE